MAASVVASLNPVRSNREQQTHHAMRRTHASVGCETSACGANRILERRLERPENTREAAAQQPVKSRRAKKRMRDVLRKQRFREGQQDNVVVVVSLSSEMFIICGRRRAEFKVTAFVFSGLRVCMFSWLAGYRLARVSTRILSADCVWCSLREICKLFSGVASMSCQRR